MAAIQSWTDAFHSQADVSAERRAAFAEFLARGLPTPKHDDWKYTDLRRLEMKSFKSTSELANGASLAEIESELLPLPNAIRLVFVDGVPVFPATHADIKVARTDHTLGVSNAFALLNTALTAQAISIEIAADAVAAPLYIAHVWTAHANERMSHPRVHLRVGRDARATLIEHSLGFNLDANFTNSALEIDIAEHATLDHLRVQDDAFANFDIANVRAQIATGAAYRHFHYLLGGALARSNIAIQLRGRDASVELNGLILAQQSQHLDVHTCIDHQVPHTRSREDYRGIADGRGRVVFTGKVVVAQDAQKTDAAQSSRNLLLSPQAEIDTRPVLEIYADDVKCAHGATVGQLDSAALFYLRSRGLSADTARAVLTHAFAAELIERAPLADVRDHILGRVLSRLHTGVAP